MDELRPRTIPVYAGIRSELDREFLKRIQLLPAGINLSEEIKRVYVEHKRMRSEVSEVNRLRREFEELRTKVLSGAVMASTDPAGGNMGPSGEVDPEKLREMERKLDGMGKVEW